MRRGATVGAAIGRDAMARDATVRGGSTHDGAAAGPWTAIRLRRFAPRIDASRSIVSRRNSSIWGARCLLFLLGLLSAAAGAQGYPSKPVRFMVSFSAGSGSDTIARIVAGGLSQFFGQQVIVENRAGASGNIGAEIAAKAPADGYTLFLVNMGHAASVTLHQKLGYDLVRDFAPVTQLASSPSMMVVHPSLPVRSLAELVKLAKAKPGAIHYGSGGIGTPTFVAGELFKGQAGVDLLHVPYKSGGEAIVGVVTGEVPLYFAPLSTALPHVQQGRLRPLAVTTLKRLPVLPQYPTVAELGYPGYQAGNWYGLMVPAKTSKETVATIRGAAIKALNDPPVNRRLTELGYVIVGDQPEEFAAHLKSEIASLAKVLKGIRPSR
jgi:tripartite-type tricarboxylate transporter receptor subunit TctC